jgi:protein O-mannosyl-transferase
MSKKGNSKQTIKAQATTNNMVRPAENKNSSQISASKFDLKKYLVIGLVLIVTYFAFSNVKNFKFVNWDDGQNFYDNKLITTLNAENFWKNTKEIFQSDVIGGYNPLTIWTFALEQRFHGDQPYTGLSKPGNWHLTNVFLHLISVFFAFKISRKLGLSLIGAGFTALLFGIHPMRVESVAWVTERKDVLFGVFYIIALYCYLKHKLEQKWFYLVLTFLFFILSLFSKIQAVTFPLSLLAIDYLITKKLEWKSLITKIPYFMLALAFGIYGVSILAESKTLEGGNTVYPFWQRIFVGSHSYFIYLVKLIIPYELSPLYPYPREFPKEFYPTILILPITIFTFIYAYKKHWTVVIFALSFFIFNVFFLLQIIGAGQGFIADRFTYIAYFGMFFGFGYLLDNAIKSTKYKISGLSIAIISSIIYLYITIKQVNIWENSGTMWTHVIKYYDNITTPFGNRANYYRDEKLFDLAIKDYNKTIALQPSAATYNSRARMYFDAAGNSQDTLMLSLEDYKKAIEMDSTEGEYFVNQGAIYARLGQLDKALESLNSGLKLKPDQVNGYLNRSLVHLNLNMPEKALEDYKIYLTYMPYHADIWYERGRVNNFLKKNTEAITHLNRAIELDNTKGFYYYERAMVYLNMGNKMMAKNDIATAKAKGYTQINPAFEAQVNQ